MIYKFLFIQCLVGLLAFTSFSQEENEIPDWQLQDFTTDFRGTNVEKTYIELLAGKQPQEKVVVAVIDSGVDIEHEDLMHAVWVNTDEIPDNGIDDDNNGYVDDINGWNFLGNANGDMVDVDNLEITRVYRTLSAEFADVVTAADISEDRLDRWKYYQRVKNEFEDGKMKADRNFTTYSEFQASYDIVMSQLKLLFGDEFTTEQVVEWVPEDEIQENIKGFYLYIDENEVDDAYLAEYGSYVTQRRNWYDIDFDVRKEIIKDDPTNLYEKGYGNAFVEGPDATHGTHVAGIIAANRGNDLGIKGVASYVEIMAIRAVPNGDEHDKDVANAIRYAVDNGARVVNMSFGKSYSPNEKIVAEAIQYAEDNDVLLIHAAGNEGQDLDESENFPTNFSDYLKGKVDTYITVGATSFKADEEFIASFSNYGEQKVDVFAPGWQIYSTVPDNEYQYLSGTSFSAPVVSGVAALMMSYFPDLSAKDVKKIIEKSAKALRYAKVYLPGSGGVDENGVEEPKITIDFEKLSRTAGLLDAYEAIKEADKKSKY
mgnify:CR=1 FL=1